MANAGGVADTINNAASYVWGTCTWFVAETFSWIPAGLGNAKDWLANAQKKGLQTESTPHVGDVVVYGAGHGYDPNYGHVAIVTAVNPVSTRMGPTFTVEEMNAKGLDVVSTRTSTMADVLGFIKPPSASSGNSTTQDCSQYNSIDPRLYICMLQQTISGTESEVGKWVVRIGLFVAGGILLIIGLVVLFRPQIEAVQAKVGDAATKAGEAAALA